MSEARTYQPGMGLEGKNVVVLGVADESSIAWGMVEAFVRHGARVRIGYQQKFFSRVRLLLQRLPSVQGSRCDILKEDELTAFFSHFQQDPVDVLVHAIAFGPPEVFTEPASGLSAQGFSQTMAISAHSLGTVVRCVKPYLKDWGSIITVTFQASERAVPMYGTMGVAKSALESLVRYLALELGRQKVRVNAISAGPIETVASLGEALAFVRNPSALSVQRGRLFETAIREASQEISRDRFDYDVAMAKAVWSRVQKEFASKCPIEEFVSKEDVADCALFLGSDYSKKITGQVIHVDCGLSSAMIM
ncbi:MAG: enoyl-ACP reductase [Acidobacteriota bacterium]